MRTSIRIEAANRVCEDRAEVLTIGPTTYLILADGAGGVSGGARAAQMMLDILRQSVSVLECGQPSLFADLLLQASRLIEANAEAGETTGILAAITDGQIFGASAGDSEAWLFSQAERVNLTARQAKTRRLGTAEASPIPFGPVGFDGTLVLGSDGLWKYVSMDRIAGVAKVASLDEAADQLVDSVRLRSGALQDDIAVILCR